MKYTSDVKLDNETGEYYIQIPNILLKELGWNSNTDLEWNIIGNELELKEVKNEISTKQ